MEKYDEFKSLKIKKIKSPKSPKRKNPLFKSLKKQPIKSSSSSLKKISITPKRSKKNLSIPVELNFKKELSPIISLEPKPDKLPSKPSTSKSSTSKPSTSKSSTSKSSTSKSSTSKPSTSKSSTSKSSTSKPSNSKSFMKSKKKINKYRDKTISVSLKSKEKDINKIIKTFDDMAISDIQTKLKSKGINTKNTNKNKLLKYIYLLTCVDDDINIIKG